METKQLWQKSVTSGGRWGGMEEREFKEAEESFKGDECVHYFDCGDGLTGVDMSRHI